MRSPCPLNCTLELVGDKWSLLIIREMLFLGKETYSELLEMKEGISSNILADRLSKMTNARIIAYSGEERRKKYYLTEMGMDLKPVLESIAQFGMKHFEGSKAYLEGQMKQ